jgi:hypothetical protein
MEVLLLPTDRIRICAHQLSYCVLLLFPTHQLPSNRHAFRSYFRYNYAAILMLFTLYKTLTSGRFFLVVLFIRFARFIILCLYYD